MEFTLNKWSDTMKEHSTAAWLTVLFCFFPPSSSLVHKHLFVWPLLTSMYNNSRYSLLICVASHNTTGPCKLELITNYLWECKKKACSHVRSSGVGFCISKSSTNFNFFRWWRSRFTGSGSITQGQNVGLAHTVPTPESLLCASSSALQTRLMNYKACATPRAFEQTT